jgi:transposase InsO family protein
MSVLPKDRHDQTAYSCFTIHYFYVLPNRMSQHRLHWSFSRLVIIDAFSRWTELYICNAATALEAAKSLYQHFGRYGAPRQIRSDRGSHFANATIAEFLSLVGTQHCLTLSYSSQQNAIVERVNKEINRHVRAWIYDANYRIC